MEENVKEKKEIQKGREIQWNRPHEPDSLGLMSEVESDEVINRTEEE